jgi:outer membrane protein assembly factor BamA
MVLMSQISEEDYNKTITQLKMKLKKQYLNFDKPTLKKQIDDNGYVKFLKSYSDYSIEKPTTADNLSFYLNTNLDICTGI